MLEILPPRLISNYRCCQQIHKIPENLTLGFQKLVQAVSNTPWPSEKSGPGPSSPGVTGQWRKQIWPSAQSTAGTKVFWGGPAHLLPELHDLLNLAWVFFDSNRIYPGSFNQDDDILHFRLKAHERSGVLEKQTKVRLPTAMSQKDQDEKDWALKGRNSTSTKATLVLGCLHQHQSHFCIRNYRWRCLESCHFCCWFHRMPDYLLQRKRKTHTHSKPVCSYASSSPASPGSFRSQD